MIILLGFALFVLSFRDVKIEAKAAAEAAAEAAKAEGEEGEEGGVPAEGAPAEGAAPA